jgi:TonB family protein
MKIVATIVLLSTFFTTGLLAQSQASSAKAKRANSHEAFDACMCDLEIGSNVAETLLIHRVDPVWKHTGTEGRVSGTVVVAFVINSKGKVLNPSVVSGPAMLRKPVLDAVRKYKYIPYLLNGKAIDVETTVHVTTANY